MKAGEYKMKKIDLFSIKPITDFSDKSLATIPVIIHLAKHLICDIYQHNNSQKIKLKGKVVDFYFQIFDDSSNQIIILKHKNNDIRLKLNEPEFQIKFDHLLVSLNELIQNEFHDSNSDITNYTKKRYYTFDRQSVIYLENHPEWGLEFIASLPLLEFSTEKK